MNPENKILLHVCCAPCASAPVERLLSEGYSVTLFFSNSNISPIEEYAKRLQYAHSIAEIYHLKLEEDVYDHLSWITYIKGLEYEPERGARCHKCFEYNLSRAADCAERLDHTTFTTTLTVSPHKPSKVIFQIGEQFSRFEPIDFKKKHGFHRSTQLTKEYCLYRQNYCGCEFSIRST